MCNSRRACKDCGQIYRGWGLVHYPTPCEKCGGDVVVVDELETTQPPKHKERRLYCTLRRLLSKMEE